MGSYNFGNSSFSHVLSINGGTNFRNPQRMEVEFITSGRFGVEVSGPDYIEIAQRPNLNGGWHTFDFRNGGEFNGGVPNGDYSLFLCSLDDLPMKVRAGQLWFDG